MLSESYNKALTFVDVEWSFLPQASFTFASVSSYRSGYHNSRYSFPLFFLVLSDVRPLV